MHEVRITVDSANSSAPFIVDSFAVLPASATETASATRSGAPLSTPSGGSGNVYEGGTSAKSVSVGAIIGAALGGVVFILLVLLAVWLWRRRVRKRGPIIKGVRHVPPTAAMRDRTSVSIGEYKFKFCSCP